MPSASSWSCLPLHLGVRVQVCWRRLCVRPIVSGRGTDSGWPPVCRSVRVGVQVVGVPVEGPPGAWEPVCVCRPTSTQSAGSPCTVGYTCAGGSCRPCGMHRGGWFCCPAGSVQWPDRVFATNSLHPTALHVRLRAELPGEGVSAASQCSTARVLAHPAIPAVRCWHSARLRSEKGTRAVAGPTTLCTGADTVTAACGIQTCVTAVPTAASCPM